MSHIPATDPLISLAVSLQANAGVYALLLGSGLSRSAGVPTGWDIVLDLIRKLARVQNAECEPDPARWYRETFGHDPSYSDLIGQLELSPSARTQLLREYFEPSEREREEGKKRPTAAHHAVARLGDTPFESWQRQPTLQSQDTNSQPALVALVAAGASQV